MNETHTNCTCPICMPNKPRFPVLHLDMSEYQAGSIEALQKELAESRAEVARLTKRDEKASGMLGDLYALLWEQGDSPEITEINARDRILGMRHTIARLTRELDEAREALRLYADPTNWQCNRCKGTDHLNCFMGRWCGPTGMPEREADEIIIGDYHGWTMARRALGMLDVSPAPIAEQPELFGGNA